MAILTGPSRPEVLGGFELPFIIGLAGAMLAAGLAAWIIGLMTLRLRHEYLAVATFGIAVTIHLICLNWESVTGGTLGLIGIPELGPRVQRLSADAECVLSDDCGGGRVGRLCRAGEDCAIALGPDAESHP